MAEKSKRVPCEYCGKPYTQSGMVRHVASAHPMPPDGWAESKGAPSQRVAVDRVIGFLEAMHQLEDVDAARVEVCRGLATVVDAMPFDSGLWGQYRAAVSDLVPVTKDNDALDDLLADIQGTPGR